MALAVSILLFALLMGAITYYGYRMYARPTHLYEQIGTQVVAGQWDQQEAKPNAVVKIVAGVGEKAPVSPQDVTYSRRLLIAAGFRSETAPMTYYGLRILLAVFFVLFALLVRSSLTSSTILGTILLIGAGALGYFIPSLWLDHLVDARRERLRFALPDALDLLVVGVEAGLGLDQALDTVARELNDAHPDIAEELNILHLEMRAGTARADALRNMARRSGERSIRQLVSIMIQSDRFGTSMADALRTHAEFLRMRRRQEAEERANKVGVKLVFPIFFFILPSMLVVAAGAGVLQMVKFLFPLMQNYRVGGM